VSTTRDGSSGNGGPPPQGKKRTAPVAPQSSPVERRSVTRPKFIEGWHKALKRKLAQAQAASPSAAKPGGRVDIWVANPDALLQAESALKLLSNQDWSALNRTQDPSIRRSGVAARVLLRIGLSQAADHKVPPSDWRFATAANNRPVVAGGLPLVHFSISHVDQLAIVAISLTHDVGIDVECIDQNVSKNVIAEFCHLDEHHSVGGLPRPQEIREFIRLWTLKEAYAKMIGLGHALDFKMIKFTLDPIDLKSAGEGRKRNGSTQFETFYVSYKHALFHASLAIRHPPASVGSTEVHIISLANAEGNDVAPAAPLSD
jgi:4'-phosphopantetheinyl transferase